MPGKVEGTLTGPCDQDSGQAVAVGLAGAGPVSAAHLEAAQGQGVHHHGKVQAVGGAQQEPWSALHRQWHFPV